jgi:hypothetical protein
MQVRILDLNNRKVLAITKRAAQFCGTQSLLQASGIELVAAKDMAAARKLMGALTAKGVILCMHSWSDRERESFQLELTANYPEVTVIVRCPGCSGHDEASLKPGILDDTEPFLNLTSRAICSAPS